MSAPSPPDPRPASQVAARSAAGPPGPGARLSAALAAAKLGGAPALVAFLTAGYPSRERFLEHLDAVARAADAVEIGVPFSDPMAEGLTIQRSSEAALRAGVTLEWILEQLQRRAPGATPLLLMSYLNPLLALGFSELAARAARAGVCGLIVPDLPWDESLTLRAALNEAGLALVQLVSPVTPPPRLASIAAASQGFVYAVTMTGTTGHHADLGDRVVGYLQRVRAASPLPVCAGFGIRTREQVERLHGHVDGVVIGSALVEVLERGQDPESWLQGLRPRRA